MRAPIQKGKDRLVMLKRAGYSYFYCKTDEMSRAVDEICSTFNSYTNPAGANPYKTVIWDLEKYDGDPNTLPEIMESCEEGSVVIAKNYNWFLKDEYGGVNKQVVTFLQNRVDKFSSEAKALLVVSNAEFEIGRAHV